MLTLVLGPGGPLRRLGAELVPTLVGGAGGWTAGALWGAAAGWTAGLAVGLGLSAALRRVRARPLLRRLYRLALLAHVLFWSALGWSGTQPAPAGPPGAVERAGWEHAQPFRAGSGEAAFRLPVHATFGGWGQRPRRVGVPPAGGFGVLGRLTRDLMAARDAEGRARAPLFREPEPGGDSLGARALVLLPSEPGPTLAFVRLDLVTSDAWVAEEVARQTRDLGVTPATLLVSATHTHSGLGGYARDPLTQLLATDHFDPAAFEGVVDAAVASVRAAVAGARPARLAFAEGHDRGPDGAPILASRRGVHEGEPIDDRVLALRVDGQDGRPLAVLLDYAVHPVATRKEHLALDRDVPGAVEEALSARLAGAPRVLFVQGALADVVPAFLGAPRTPRAPREAAERFAEALAPALEQAPAFERLEVHAARVERDLGDPRLVAGLGARGLLLDDGSLRGPFQGPAAGIVADALALPLNAFVWSLGFTEVRAVGSVRGACGVLVNLRPHVARRTHAVGGLLLSASSADGTRSARLPLVWAPGEPSQELGRAWREAWASAGDRLPMVMALTNGSIGYVVTGAEQRSSYYEALATLFGSETDRLLTEGLERVRAALAK